MMCSIAFGVMSWLHRMWKLDSLPISCWFFFVFLCFQRRLAGGSQEETQPGDDKQQNKDSNEFTSRVEHHPSVWNSMQNSLCWDTTTNLPFCFHFTSFYICAETAHKQHQWNYKVTIPPWQLTPTAPTKRQTPLLALDSWFFVINWMWCGVDLPAFEMMMLMMMNDLFDSFDSFWCFLGDECKWVEWVES